MLEAPEACTAVEAVRVAAESVLGTEVGTVSRLPFGNVNEVFRVESAGRAYAVKVFRNAGWPEAGKLPWVESRLTQYEVPHARLIHYTRDASRFPHGFSVCEFAEGENCKGLIREGRLTPEAFCERAASLLRRVHAISVPRYGYIGDGEGMCEDFVGWLLACEVFDNLRKVDDGSSPAETLRPRFEDNVESVLRRFEKRFKPVLVHADCTPKNGLLDAEGRFLFVDWDEAVAGIAVWDYASLTYWYSYMLKDGGARNADGFRDTFFRGYGAVDFDHDELRDIEWALHTTQAAGELSYLYMAGDATGYRRARELLLRLLDTSHARLTKR
jgi:aminoglycoside phosphotransferase (APT) family kinase protein